MRVHDGSIAYILLLCHKTALAVIKQAERLTRLVTIMSITLTPRPARPDLPDQPSGLGKTRM